MKNSFQLIAALTGICLVSGVLLAFVHGATAARIEETARRRTEAAVEAVLPQHDRIQDPVEIVHAGQVFLFRSAWSGSEWAGVAVETTTSAGYGGAIRLMLGIAADGTTSGLSILAHKETPGLGAKITDASFRALFVGRPVATTRWRVRKDGGEIDELTAATVSSRAVSDAVAAAIQAFDRNQAEIRAPKEQEP